MSRSQGINNNGIDVVLPEYSGFSTRKINSSAPRGCDCNSVCDFFYTPKIVYFQYILLHLIWVKVCKTVAEIELHFAIKSNFSVIFLF